MSSLTLKLEGDAVVVVTRRFEATPEYVFRAHTEPELIQRWMLGPDGWSMPECEYEARPGGGIRYEWRNEQGHRIFLTGECLEVQPFTRLVHVERLFLPDRTPDKYVETTFEADGAGTLLTARMTLPDAASRAAMISTGIEQGIEASYDRLEGLIQSREASVIPA